MYTYPPTHKHSLTFMHAPHFHTHKVIVGGGGSSGVLGSGNSPGGYPGGGDGMNVAGDTK